MKQLTFKSKSHIQQLYKIPSQTSIGCKQALEIIEDIIISSGNRKSYSYVETGSYLGGSICPRLDSGLAIKILSIDKRVNNQDDERRMQGYNYKGVTTKQMIDNLSFFFDEVALNKLSCYDGTIVEYVGDPANESSMHSFDWVFIDAEHTNLAVVEDFCAAYKLIPENGIISFHDSWMTYSGIHNIYTFLSEMRNDFRFCHINGNVSGFFFGSYSEYISKNEDISNQFLNLDVHAFALKSRERLWLKQKKEILRTSTFIDWLVAVLDFRTNLARVIKKLQVRSLLIKS